MEIKEIYKNLDSTISKFSDISVEDKQDLEKVIGFGISAICSLEALVEAVLEPIIHAKKELFKSQDAENVKNALIEIATNIYDELDSAQNMIFKFSALNDSFNVEIEPILSKYFDMDVVENWRNLFDMTRNTRNISYKRVESLIPKIEQFLESRYYSGDDEEGLLTFKDLKDYLNGIIDEMRSSKRDLQEVKSKMLKLSGLKGLTNLTQNVISGEGKTDGFEAKLKSIETSVAEGRTETALDKLVELCTYNYSEILKDVLILQGQFNNANRNFYLGLENDKITPNKVNLGILDLVNEIRKNKVST